MKHTSGPVRGSLLARWSPNRFSGGHWHWYARVTVGDVTIWADDCRDREKLLPTLRGTVYAARRMQELGIEKFVTWDYQVDQAVI